MSLQLPESPVGRRVRWYIDRLSDEAALSAEEKAAHFEPAANIYAPPLDDPRGWRILHDGRHRFDDPAVAVKSETSLEIEGATPEGKRWRYRFAVDPSTERFTELVIEWVQEEEITVRRATEADGPALADIERRSPIVAGDVRITIDRGADYFAAARLMEDVTVAVADVDGVPGAVNCAAAHTVCVGGKPHRMGYFHHLRILPEHQRKGLFQQLGRALGDYMPPRVDGTYAYVAPDNAPSQRLFSFAEAWPAAPLMCELAVADLRGPAAGRQATPADADAIAGILNECHRDEEMFCPYTNATLVARLERAPQQYGWSNVKLSERAVAGVWPAGESISVIVESPQERRVEREGFLLDHGFLPGAEDEFERLLRAWCDELAERGFTRLVTFSSEQSPNYDVLCSLKAEMQPFDLFVFGPERPEEAGRRGVYVDLIYF